MAVRKHRTGLSGSKCRRSLQLLAACSIQTVETDETYAKVYAYNVKMLAVRRKGVDIIQMEIK